MIFPIPVISPDILNIIAPTIKGRIFTSRCLVSTLAILSPPTGSLLSTWPPRYSEPSTFSMSKRCRIGKNSTGAGEKRCLFTNNNLRSYFSIHCRKYNFLQYELFHPSFRGKWFVPCEPERRKHGYGGRPFTRSWRFGICFSYLGKERIFQCHR